MLLKSEKINQALNEAKDHTVLSGRKKSQVEGTMSEKVLKAAHQRNRHKSDLSCSVSYFSTHLSCY